jgi:flap endonuclease-1
MGIEGLLAHLKKLNPDIIHRVKIDKYAGKRIGVDAYNFLYAHFAIAQKGVNKKTDVINEEADRNEMFKIVMQMFLDFYLKCCSINILLIMAFDGKKIPEKIGTLQRRSKQSDKTKERIADLEAKLENKDPLEINETDVDELRKLKNQYNSVSKEEIQRFKDILIELGIPYIVSTFEGEKACAMLSRDGITAATYGKDSDLLAYGNRSILNNLKLEGYNINGIPNYTMSEIDLKEVLILLKMNYVQFVDYCIMLGCDYGIRIKGMGPVKCYDFIIKEKCIENLKVDYKCLNHEFCRREFAYLESKEMIDSGGIEIGIMGKCDNLCELGLGGYIAKIKEYHLLLKVGDTDKNVNNEFMSVKSLNETVETKKKINVILNILDKK